MSPPDLSIWINAVSRKLESLVISLRPNSIVRCDRIVAIGIGFSRLGRRMIRRLQVFCR